MYEKLPLDYINVTSKFGYREDPITGVTKYHYGVDFGWHKYKGAPIYAPHDAVVVTEAYNSSMGNYVVLKHDKNDKTIITRYFHLRERAIVKSGKQLKQGDIIGYMGSTGYSTGVHLHFEYWICPKGYNYNSSERSKYAVDPLKHVYLFEDQEVSSKANSLVQKIIGKPILKDENKNQLKVIDSKLRCRTTPSLEGTNLGYINYGYYDILDTEQADNYIWYKIGKDRWIANVEGNIEIYLVNSNSNELQTENEELKLQLEAIEKNYKIFKCEKSDYYYIYLEKDEKIYYPKSKN